MRETQRRHQEEQEKAGSPRQISPLASVTSHHNTQEKRDEKKQANEKDENSRKHHARHDEEQVHAHRDRRHGVAQHHEDASRVSTDEDQLDHHHRHETVHHHHRDTLPEDRLELGKHSGEGRHGMYHHHHHHEHGEETDTRKGPEQEVQSGSKHGQLTPTEHYNLRHEHKHGHTHQVQVSEEEQHASTLHRTVPVSHHHYDDHAGPNMMQQETTPGSPRAKKKEPSPARKLPRKDDTKTLEILHAETAAEFVLSPSHHFLHSVLHYLSMEIALESHTVQQLSCNKAIRALNRLSITSKTLRAAIEALPIWERLINTVFSSVLLHPTSAVKEDKVRTLARPPVMILGHPPFYTWFAVASRLLAALVKGRQKKSRSVADEQRERERERDISLDDCVLCLDLRYACMHIDPVMHVMCVVCV
jgi:hypothetical protein